MLQNYKNCLNLPCILLKTLAEENAFHRMDLAIRWNRFDIAKREMQELVILKEIPVQNRNEERINPSKIVSLVLYSKFNL